jgi:hypothetical protein
MRWSKLKQLVEQRFADSLNGRVEVHSTRYYSGEGRGWITVDKHEVADFSTLGFFAQAYQRAKEQAGTDFTDPDAEEQARYYKALREEQAALRNEGALRQADYHRLLWDSLALSIDDASGSEAVLIRALAMLDRRLGKRRLRAFRLRDNEHPLVRQFYLLRCESEGIKPANEDA